MTISDAFDNGCGNTAEIPYVSFRLENSARNAQQNDNKPAHT